MKTPKTNNDICYKRTFLKEVIARVDFLNPIQGLKGILPKELNDFIKKNFPVPESNKAFTHSFQVKGEKIKTAKEEFDQWDFHGLEKEKTISLSKNFLLVSYKKYGNYNDLKNEFLSSAKILSDHFPEAQVSRSGLRYINVIKINESEPLDWSKYINPKLLQSMDFNSKESLIRYFNLSEYKFENINMKHHYGIFNPDYPALIKNKEFILDFDAYYNGLHELSLLNEIFKEFHAKIQIHFENSITDDLRRQMNEE